MCQVHSVTTVTRERLWNLEGRDRRCWMSHCAWNSPEPNESGAPDRSTARGAAAPSDALLGPPQVPVPGPLPYSLRSCPSRVSSGLALGSWAHGSSMSPFLRVPVSFHCSCWLRRCLLVAATTWRLQWRGKSPGLEAGCPRSSAVLATHDLGGPGESFPLLNLQLYSAIIREPSSESLKTTLQLAP